MSGSPDKADWGITWLSCLHPTHSTHSQEHSSHLPSNCRSLGKQMHTHSVVRRQDKTKTPSEASTPGAPARHRRTRSVSKGVASTLNSICCAAASCEARRWPIFHVTSPQPSPDVLHTSAHVQPPEHIRPEDTTRPLHKTRPARP